MKKLGTLALVLLLIMALLAGCGGGSASTAAPSAASTSAPAPAPTANAKLKVTILNESGYIFNELYVTPTADNMWGTDHLGSTNILKSGGSFEITLDAYQYNTYDIRVVDEDRDVYLFERVDLKNGAEVEIVWDSGPGAYVGDTFYAGELESEGDSDSDDDDTWIEMFFYNETGWDFDEVYVYATGESNIGYNHVANTPLYNENYVLIGVDNYYYFDIVCVDEDGDTWVFEDVYLEDSCDLTFFFESSPTIEILYADISTSSYDGYIA